MLLLRKCFWSGIDVLNGAILILVMTLFWFTYKKHGWWSVRFIRISRNTNKRGMANSSWCDARYTKEGKNVITATLCSAQHGYFCPLSTTQYKRFDFWKFGFRQQLTWFWVRLKRPLFWAGSRVPATITKVKEGLVKTWPHWVVVYVYHMGP